MDKSAAKFHQRRRQTKRSEKEHTPTFRKYFRSLMPGL
jgi:hypothetical protein